MINAPMRCMTLNRLQNLMVRRKTYNQPKNNVASCIRSLLFLFDIFSCRLNQSFKVLFNIRRIYISNSKSIIVVLITFLLLLLNNTAQCVNAGGEFTKKYFAKFDTYSIF